MVGGPVQVSGLMLRLTQTSLFLAVVLCFSRTSAFTTNLIGSASVIDGDTLEIHGTRIRLWGIDAPESSQLCRGEDSLPYRCGAKAANELDRFIGGRPVAVSRDLYGRTVATCSVNGIHCAEWLVRGGLAFDWPRYSKGEYDNAQRQADHPGRGVLGGQLRGPMALSSVRQQGRQAGDCSDGTNIPKLN
ncbi:endonuclease YncB(thermonuclease family) [Bradyrhizobium sp. LM2.7]